MARLFYNFINSSKELYTWLDLGLFAVCKYYAGYFVSCNKRFYLVPCFNTCRRFGSCLYCNFNLILVAPLRTFLFPQYPVLKIVCPFFCTVSQVAFWPWLVDYWLGGVWSLAFLFCWFLACSLVKKLKGCLINDFSIKMKKPYRLAFLWLIFLLTFDLLVNFLCYKHI